MPFEKALGVQEAGLLGGAVQYHNEDALPVAGEAASGGCGVTGFQALPALMQ